MKNLLILLSLTLTINVFSNTNLVYNDINIRENLFVEFMLNELNISNTTVLIKRTNKEVYGYVQRSRHGVYIIYVNMCNTGKGVGFKHIVSHELVHVKQDIGGRLDINKGTTKVINGHATYVDNESKVLEIEAINVSKELLKKYRRQRR